VQQLSRLLCSRIEPDEERAIGSKLCRSGMLEKALQSIVRQVLNWDLLVDVIPNNGDVDVSEHKR